VFVIVIDDGREVGRLYEDRYTPPELRWFWLIILIIVIGAYQTGIMTQRARPDVRGSQGAIRDQLSQVAGVGWLEVGS
jgi:hypothetical protein